MCYEDGIISSQIEKEVSFYSMTDMQQTYAICNGKQEQGGENILIALLCILCVGSFHLQNEF